MQFNRRNFLISGGLMVAGGWGSALKACEDRNITVSVVGDLILDAPDPNSYFTPSRALLSAADVTIGQVEVPHTLRGRWANPEPSSAPGADPAYLQAMQYAGFDVATLSGNHVFDQGAEGVEDTIAALRALGIATSGGGLSLEAARKPASVERKGRRIAVLNFNLVGPEVSWAAPMKAGGAYVRVITSYVNDRAEPGGMPSGIYTTPDPATMAAMIEDIRAARTQADIVIVYFHSGRAGTPVILTYQTQLTRAAVEAGASMVACAHTHSLLGGEMYRDVPIFHGLGNFVTVTGAMQKSAENAKQRAHRPFASPVTNPPVTLNAYTRGPDEPPHASPYYPFTEQSRNTMIACVDVDAAGKLTPSLVPCWIDDQARPVPHERGAQGEAVLDYIRDLSARAGFATRFNWDAAGKKVLIS